MRQARQFHWSHFAGKKAETQISDFTCLRSESESAAEYGPEPRSPESSPSTFINPIVTALVLVHETSQLSWLQRHDNMHSCFRSSSPSSNSNSLSHFNGVRVLKLNLILKILALGHCWYHNESLLGVHTPTRLTWQCGEVNVTRRGLLTNENWKPLWKISYFSLLSPSIVSPFWKDVGSLGKWWSNWLYLTHQLGNISSCWLFLFPCFTPLNPLLLFPRLGSLFPRLRFLGSPG